jgi:hypothetical protein
MDQSEPDPVAVMLYKVARDHRLGLILMLTGVVIMLATFGSQFVPGATPGSGSTGFLTTVFGTLGFALVLAGGVFFFETRAFLRQNDLTR